MNLSGLNVNCKSVRTNHRGNGRLIGRVRARTHVPCLHGEKDGWVTVSREFSGYSKMCNCSFQDTKSACVGVERTQEEKKEKKKRDRRQRKSIRDWKAFHAAEKVKQVYTQRGRRGALREDRGREQERRRECENKARGETEKERKNPHRIERYSSELDFGVRELQWGGMGNVVLKEKCSKSRTSWNWENREVEGEGVGGRRGGRLWEWLPRLQHSISIRRIKGGRNNNDIEINKWLRHWFTNCSLS